MTMDIQLFLNNNGWKVCGVTIPDCTQPEFMEIVQKAADIQNSKGKTEVGSFWEKIVNEDAKETQKGYILN